MEVIAYLDPGSGSMILQIIVGGIAGIAVSAKMFWGRITSKLGFRRNKAEETQTPDSSTTT
jgi:hypothetical protein